MPTITLNKKVFEQLVGKELPLEELKDRISMLGTDLESIEDNEIHVEIFPNRPDMLSEQGFARAFSSFIGLKTGLREYQVKESGQKVIIDPSVNAVRPFTACAVVKSLELNQENIDEIIQIQEKLHVTYGRNRKKCAIGVYPLEKITFPITYKADLPEKIVFQPLDSDREMTAKEILTEHKTGKEFAHLLEGKETYPFFIDAQGEILSMPPIINSQKTGQVTTATKDLFIECSGFDFPTLSTCLNIIVTALAEMGGEIDSLELDYGNNEDNKITPNLSPSKMKLDLEYVNKRLGLKLTEQKAKELLERMGFGYEGKVLVPAYRADILHQADLVEDIAIAYGYENFQEEIPNVATIGEENVLNKFIRKVRALLIGFKLLEVKNYHLMTITELNQKMNQEGVEDKEKDKKIIPLKNALGEHNHLRNALLPSLLKNLAENQHYEYPQNLFEIGKTFLPDDSETNVNEEVQLAIVLCHEKADFTEIKQILDALALALNLKFSVKETDHPSYITGRVGKIFLKEKEIGIIGEISPQVLTNWDLNTPTVGLELNLEKIFTQLL